MAISQRLDLRQNQSLVMTPQLQQAIKLLQLSNAELTEFVEEELNQNPMLERDEGDAPIREDSEQEIVANSTEAVTSDDEFSGPDSLDLTAGDNIPDSAEKPLDLDYENVWDDAHPRDVSDEVIGGFENVAPIGAGGRSDYSEGLGDFEATLSDEPTLREHLLEQLTLDILESGDRIIGSAQLPGHQRPNLLITATGKGSSPMTFLECSSDLPRDS